MGSRIVFWGRADDAETQDAQRFLKQNGYRADEVRDLDRSGPVGTEWDAIRKGLGGLRGLVDTRSPRCAELLPGGADGVDDDRLQALLETHPELRRAPVLLTPKGALAGFRERKWRDFLDIGKGRS